MLNVVQPDNLTNARSGRPNIAAMLPYNPGPSALSAETNFYSSAFPLLFSPISPTSTTPNGAVTVAGSEAIILLLGRNQYAVQASGTFVATVTIEVSLDTSFTVWKALDTFTVADLRQYSGIYYAMRVRISAWTSGNPLVTVLMQR
jgi:hypothetical protein